MTLISRPNLNFLARKSYQKVILILLMAGVNLGGFSAIARAASQQITVSIDGTHIRTYEALLAQAEGLVTNLVNEKFNADRSLTDLHITILGERDGQIVSLLTASLSRDDWQSQPNVQDWIQYFTTSSALLGYTNYAPISTRANQSPRVEVRLEPEQDAFTTADRAFAEGRISSDEYYELIDSLD